MSGINSPALQHHLSGEQSENGEGAQINYPDKDIRCPAIPTKGLNAYRTNCIDRLTARVVQVPCRRCPEAVKIVQEENLAVQGIEELVCSGYNCTNPVTPGYKTCTYHREKAKKYYHNREFTQEQIDAHNKNRRDRRAE